LLLIQFKYKKRPSTDQEDQIKSVDIPKRWYQCLSKIEKMKKCKGITVIYVYITTANIPKKGKEALESCKRLIIIEQANARQFFAPNLLPYFATIDQEEEEGEEEEEEEEEEPDISEEIALEESPEKQEQKRKRSIDDTKEKKPKK
jgi:hypothetical protein